MPAADLESENDMNGVLVIDKPEGFTSFDAVAVVRGLTREKKIGHTGTLDPMATGVLLLLLGRAAKAADLLADTDKEYRAHFRFGERTDTGDSTGTVLATDETPVSKETLQEVLQQFVGTLSQIPPMYSAVSVGGKRLYQLAREGKEVERKPREIHVSRCELEEYDETTREGVLLVACSKGTYIRTLIEDIAAAAGTLGVMTALRRTKACGFTVEESTPLLELKAMREQNELWQVLKKALLPVDTLFRDEPCVTVSRAQAARFCNGGSLSMERLRMPKIAIAEPTRFRVYRDDGEFLGLSLADPEQRELRFVKRFSEN